MTSARKIAANRRNGRKSRGPRTAAGKFVGSRNALRHGLAAITHRAPVPIADIERFAKALCGDDKDQELYEHALAIAREEYVLRAIGEQQRAVVERLREPTAIAPARGDNSIKLAKARLRQADEAYAELVNLRDALLEKYKDQLAADAAEDDWLNLMCTITFLVDQEEECAAENAKDQCHVATEIEEGPRERDDIEAIEEAAPDLVRLDRYERRARSRQDHAIRMFMDRRKLKAAAGREQVLEEAASNIDCQS